MKTTLLSTLSLTFIVSGGCVSSQLKQLQPTLPSNPAFVQQYFAQTGRLPVEYRLNFSKLVLALALAGVGVTLGVIAVLPALKKSASAGGDRPEQLGRSFTPVISTLEPAPVYHSPTLQTLARLNLPDLQPVSAAATPREQVLSSPELELTADAEEIKPQYKWAHQLRNYPVILLYGPQGGGKTSKLAWLTGDHARRGDELSIVDPFAPAASWRGLEVVGRGENAAEINDHLDWFCEEASRRLALRGVDESYEPLRDEPFYFMGLDEVTNYEDMVNPDIGRRFISTCTQKLRQAGMGVAISSHGDTLSCLFGIAAGKGKKAVMDRQTFKIRVMPVEDESVPGGFRCSGQAEIAYNGQVKTVTVPPYMRKPENWDYRNLVAQDDPIILAD
ncbi:MAG: hypothetical protein AAFO83_03410 [Cyanobacteria bacterium J06607_13]